MQINKKGKIIEFAPQKGGVVMLEDGTEKSFDMSAWVGMTAPREGIDVLVCLDEGMDVTGIYAQPNAGSNLEYHEHTECSNTHPEYDSVKGNIFLYIKHANFKGRASRREFWWFFLIYSLITWSMIFLIKFSDNTKVVQLSYVLLFLFGFACFFPLITLYVRRLHDTGRSGTWLLVSMIPYIGVIILLILCALPSENRKNRYGAPV